MEMTSFDTLAVHAGDDRTGHFGAVSVPIYPATVFAFSDADEGMAVHNHQKEGYFYGRLGNPTQSALERTVAEIENAEDALSFSSGMAAVSAAILTLVKTGDHIVAPWSMYSTTSSLLTHLRENFGIATTFIGDTDAETYRSALHANTRLLWIETPSNPLLNITDLSAVAAVAKECGVQTVCDNTFATPYNQHPLDHGIDLLIHSATKYLGGHSDLTAGLMAGKKEIVEKARLSTTKLYGGNISPQVAWLLLRGIKTLALRMERHNSNAFYLATALESDERVSAVHYPGLESHAGHAAAKRQMRGFGGMISFDLETFDRARSFVNNVKLCTLATSLGGVETIVQHSTAMTHAGLSAEERRTAGISEGLIRLSVGIEDRDDLLADILHALDKI